MTAAPGDRHVTTRHRLTTTARPFIGEVLRCRPPAEPERPRGSPGTHPGSLPTGTAVIADTLCVPHW